MPRIKLFLLSMLAILALGAVVSAVASAETDTCEEKEAPTALCFEEGGKLVPFASGTVVNFTSEGEKGVESLLEVSGLVHIECTTINNTGSFTQGTLLVNLLTGSVVITFENCEALEPNHACKVTVEKTEALFDFPGPDDEKVTFTPDKAGGVFAIVTLSGAECLIAGKDEVTGEVTCTLTKALEDLVTHDILCTHENKGLIFAKKAATLELEDLITLVSKVPWSVDLV